MTDIVDSLSDQTDANSAQPERVKFGNREVQQHSLESQIALEKHRAANAQAQSAGRLIFNKISPPGAV